MMPIGTGTNFLMMPFGTGNLPVGVVAIYILRIMSLYEFVGTKCRIFDFGCRTGLGKLKFHQTKEYNNF